MSYRLIDGKAIAQEVLLELKQEVAAWKKDGLAPGLAVILVGNYPASESYVRGKLKAADQVGIRSELIQLPESVSEDELAEQIVRLNEDPLFHGILVQLPLPHHIKTDRIIATIVPEKDVDGFTPINIGKMLLGYDALVACTPQGIIELLKRSNIPIAGKHAVVVGRSFIVGKPVSLLLQHENATVTMCHSRTVDLPAITRQADLLIAAVGRAEMITEEYVKPGAIVIDVGINRKENGKLVGDVKFDEVAPLTRAITPVPGGVGPMTIAMLMRNTVKAARQSRR